MYTSDKAIIRLIDVLISQNKIQGTRQFANEIKVLEQTISKVKKGINHFTVIQIETICKKYNVNANWIYGIDSKVFNIKKSIEINDFLES